MEEGPKTKIVTDLMKGELVAKIKRLSDEGLTKTVAKIEQLQKAHIREMENDQVMIRIEDFDIVTFKAVLDCVNSVEYKRQKVED